MDRVVGRNFKLGFSGIGVAYSSAVKSERGSELEMPEIVASISYWCVFALVFQGNIDGWHWLKSTMCEDSSEVGVGLIKMRVSG